MKHPKIKFQNKEYILIGETDGAITTKEAYESGTVSYAHLMESGDIMRYGETIGKREDIEFIGEENCEIGFGVLDGLFGDSWGI